MHLEFRQMAKESGIRELMRVSNIISDNIKKGVEDVYKRQSLRNAGNVHIHLDLIAGLPLEGYESFGRSFDDVFSMRPNQLQLGFLKVLKGTPMEERQERYGIRLSLIHICS